MPVPTHPADALKSCFRDVFGCRGREFGSLSRGVLGISDGNEGVQWNAGYYPRDGAVWLGVNLEGMKYDDWPVARLIEREISRPLLLTRYRRKVARPDKVTVLWARDAWQYSARRRIKEANVAPTPITLDRLDDRGWADRDESVQTILGAALASPSARARYRDPLLDSGALAPSGMWYPRGNARRRLPVRMAYQAEINRAEGWQSRML